MPTHQGNTQTDIVIGSSGDSITLDARIEFTATYGASANFQYKNKAPSADNENSSYEIKILNTSGQTIATFAAEYTCDPVPGSAKNVTSTRTNTFTPSPNGSGPTFPAAWETHATRNWSITGTKGGSTFAGFAASWKFASTVVSGGSVSYTVDTQSSDELEISLSYSDGSSNIADVQVICYAHATASGVTLGSPSVTDNIQP